MLAAEATKEINKIAVGFCIDFWIFFHYFIFHFLGTVQRNISRGNITDPASVLPIWKP